MDPHAYVIFLLIFQLLMGIHGCSNEFGVLMELASEITSNYINFTDDSLSFLLSLVLLALGLLSAVHPNHVFIVTKILAVFALP